MKLLKNKTLHLRGTYISESKVLDEENHNTYYVVVKLNDLLYATFDGSYIDYLKNGGEAPHMLEGDDYLWFDIHEDRNETIFWSFYGECLNKALALSNSQRISRKYSHIKKPLGNIHYEIIYKRKEHTFSCGPMGEEYEIKFHIFDNDTYLYVYANDWGLYCLSNASVEDNVPNSLIESIEGFDKAKKSRYYDLYLEMEKYIDGVQ